MQEGTFIGKLSDMENNNDIKGTDEEELENSNNNNFEEKKNKSERNCFNIAYDYIKSNSKYLIASKQN